MEILHQVCRFIPAQISERADSMLESYVVWIAFQIVFVYFLFPETAHKSLEELAFREYSIVLSLGFQVVDLEFSSSLRERRACETETAHYG